VVDHLGLGQAEAGDAEALDPADVALGEPLEGRCHRRLSVCHVLGPPSDARSTPGASGYTPYVIAMRHGRTAMRIPGNPPFVLARGL
jgi:hypothetical protein